MPSTDPARQARAAAEAVRRLNHATLTWQPVPAPVISSTVQALTQVTSRMPQALDQLARHLSQALADDQIRMDDGTDAGPATVDAIDALAEAVQALYAATRHLDDAAAPLFHMAAK